MSVSYTHLIRNVVISLAIGVVMVIGTLLVIRSVQSRKTA